MRTLLFSSLPLMAAALTLLLSGCGKTTQNSALATVIAPQGAYVYTVTVTKSPVNARTFTARHDAHTVSVKELLSSGEMPHTIQKTGAQEQVTMLDHVIATASKEWNLYINNTKRPFITLDDVMVEPSAEVEWRYEET